MIAERSLEHIELRLARHYASVLKQAATHLPRGQENWAYWMQMLYQDWEQIRCWQAWSADWHEKPAAPQRAALCIAFAEETSSVLLVMLTPAEQFIWLQQAYEAARAIYDHQAIFTLLYRLSYLSLTLEKPDQTEWYAQQLRQHVQQHVQQVQQVQHVQQGQKQAEKPASASSRKFNLGRAEFLLGAAAFVSGRYDEAHQHLTESLALLQACPVSGELGQVWLSLGHTASVRGQYQEAYEGYTRYLENATTMGNELAMIDANMALSGVHLALNNYQQAEEHARTAVSRARPFGTSRFLPPALFSLANIEKRSGKLEAACTHYEEGLAAAQAISSAPSSQATGWHGLGQARYLLGDAATAIDHLETGLSIARRAHYLLRVCEIAPDLVMLYTQRGEHDSAGERLREALESAQTLATPQFMTKALAGAIIWRQAQDSEQAAVWAGLLQDHLGYLQPSLFDTRFYTQLEAELGTERYTHLLAQGKTLTLSALIPEILQLRDATHACMSGASVGGTQGRDSSRPL